MNEEAITLAIKGELYDKSMAVSLSALKFDDAIQALTYFYPSRVWPTPKRRNPESETEA